MGKHLHILSEIDPKRRTAICAHCGFVRIKKLGRTPKGKQRWRCYTKYREYNPPWIGSQAHRSATTRDLSYRIRKSDHCEREQCTATIEHPGQLDVHHIDGDPTDNSDENLETLCANCHRLATLMLN